MIRIVLADDHHQVREIWRRVLSANDNFEVVSICRNGQEAIDAAASETPDVVLMDINMHPVNGIEATIAISNTHPHVKVIGMSIHTDELYVKGMLQAGAHGYITKNTDYEEMFECIIQVNAGKYYVCNEVRKKIPGLLAIS